MKTSIIKCKAKKTCSENHGSCGIKDLFEALEEYIKSRSFASLLEVRDVLNLGLVCRSFRRVFNKNYVGLVIRLGNLESRLRYLFWIKQVPYINIERRCRCRFLLENSLGNIYCNLQQAEESIRGFSRIRSLIRKDICRTYEDARIMRADSQKKMENILAALAVVYNDMEYCQGMSFIAGEILNVVEEEELAFWLFAGLIEKHHLKLLFMNGLPAVHMHMHVLSHLLEMYLPRLDIHLRKLGAGWDMFTSKLVLTLCSSYIPLDLLAYIYDVFFMDGWTGMYKIIIAFLEMHQHHLCDKDLCAISEYLRRLKESVSLSDIRKMLRRAEGLHIGKDDIEKSVDAFFRNEAEILICKKGNERWPKACEGMLKRSAARIAACKKQYDKDAEYYRSKISSVEKQLLSEKRRYASLKAEYSDMLTELQGLKDQRVALEYTMFLLGGRQSCLTQRKQGGGQGNRVNFEDRGRKMSYSEEMEGGTACEVVQEDLAVVTKKIKTIEKNLAVLSHGMKRKAKVMAECEGEISECRLRWDLLQGQVNDLGKQMSEEVYKVYQAVGDMLRKESSLSIDMYYFQQFNHL